MNDLTERRFESDIEAAFLSPAGGYVKGTDTYDARQGLYVATLIDFVRRSQPREWARFENVTKSDSVKKFCAVFNLGINPEYDKSAAQYAKNHVACYRQWHYSADGNRSVDMVPVLNGIPIFAFELKNQYTGQNVADAKSQWINDRDPREVCFQFNKLDLVQKFISLQGGRLIFPRYHQPNVVRKLIAHVVEHGAGHNYLIQHSAGSGKSNSIAWTAYRLASLHDEDNRAIFASVVVVTDRTILDAQLQETISGFDHTLGTVETIDEHKNSRDLRDAINAGVRIIVTTLQKFRRDCRRDALFAKGHFGVEVESRACRHRRRLARICRNRR